MNEQFDFLEFEQPVNEMGLFALRGLQQAVDTSERLTDGVEGVSNITAKNSIGQASQFTTEYTSVVFDEISPSVMAQDLPPMYLLETCKILANCLIEHINQRYKLKGSDALFPPHDAWLTNHINGTWLTIPRPQSEPYNASLFKTTFYRDTELQLSKVAAESDWRLMYSTTQDFVISATVNYSPTAEVNIVN